MLTKIASSCNGKNFEQTTNSKSYLFSKVKGRRDLISGQKRNKALAVSFSNKKSRKWQQVNLQNKKIFWPEGKRFVQLRISARTMRTIEKKGISSLAQIAGINLKKLPFDDVRGPRLEYLTSSSTMKVPRAKNTKNKMKNAERLAASKKKPILPCYIDGCIFWLREGERDHIYRLILAQKESDLAGQMALRAAETAAKQAKQNVFAST
eukprot:gnl/MRDRNA2_/MRDRNA2_82313_c0_seq1.p1 gnl/MRDRNA2_/MRDRNA2_82313_c0~~gnl/MRDRNA2_/MRDRNA2_82313_c0_seq1.p1  ORF type:complete len:208 (-),score=10.86 gnl/MRDRNA2_/MRDRNA2_82313_c0_seq1:150-773(-)